MFGIDVFSLTFLVGVIAGLILGASVIIFWIGFAIPMMMLGGMRDN